MKKTPLAPTPRKDWVCVGERCAHIQSGATGTVQRIIRHRSGDDVRVLWDATVTWSTPVSGVTRITMVRREA